MKNAREQFHKNIKNSPTKSKIQKTTKFQFETSFKTELSSVSEGTAALEIITLTTTCKKTLRQAEQQNYSEPKKRVARQTKAFCMKKT